MSNHISRDKGESKSHHITRQSRDGTRPTRHYSRKQETTVAKELGGHRQPNSGATPFAKGDVTLDKFLIECKTKTTASATIGVKKEWITKNTEEAMFVGKPYSAIAISFGPDEENYYIIDRHLFEELVAYLNTKEENI